MAKSGFGAGWTFILRLAGVVAALLLGASHGAFAQQNAAPPVVPSHLLMAAEVLKSSGLMHTFEQSVPNVVQMLRTNITRQRPELARDIEEALKAVEAQVPGFTNDGLQNAARFLANRMTETELKEVQTFLSSAVGKKYVETLPNFMQDMLPFLEQWTQAVGAQMTNIFRDEMAKRGHRI